MRHLTPATALVLLPVLSGFGACEALYSETPAPDVTGDWEITYDDTLAVEIQIGGAVYTSEIGLEGGSITLDHDGQPFTFDLDCEAEEVVCPSEVWAPLVSLDQREPEYPNRVWMTIPQQVCDAELIPAEPAECGEDTLNPDCDDVCPGEMITEDAETFGLISEAGDAMALLLGGGVATNGINCALLGLSVAEGELTNEGNPGGNKWFASAIDGTVKVGYAGGCLWADDVDGDEELEALVLEASVLFTTGFAAVPAAGAAPLR